MKKNTQGGVPIIETKGAPFGELQARTEGGLQKEKLCEQQKRRKRRSERRGKGQMALPAVQE